MVYVDRYGEYLAAFSTDLSGALESKKRVVFGYTSNLDVVLKWDSKTFNDLLQRYLPSKREVRAGESIESLEDLARVASYYVRQGLGGEVAISSRVCSYLERTFQSSLALGGTAAQGAAALGALGFPVLAHLTDGSREVCRLLDYPSVALVSGGRLVASLAGATKDSPIKHIILQYDRGAAVVVDASTYLVPASNRLIMDYDPLHKNLPIQKQFLDYVTKHSQDYYAYSISGFNLIVEQEVLNLRLRELEAHYTAVKRGNPACVLYLESAHYLSPQIRQTVLRRLSPLIDVLGVNEEEMADLVWELQGSAIDSGPDALLDSLALVIEHYGLRGLVLHTADYALFYGSWPTGVDLEKGLTWGNLLAGTKARVGGYGSLEDCRATLQTRLSVRGLELAAELHRRNTPQQLCIVPSRYLKRPFCTVGLGDTFVAGMQLAFVR